MKISTNTFKDRGYTSSLLERFGRETLEAVLSFQESIPDYNETSLYRLDDLAHKVGVKSIHVKDESSRFGLNAFKGVGGIYAVAEYFRKHHHLEFGNYDELARQVGELPQVIFATATDGNHGKGLAWASALLGQKAKVFMPEGAADARLEAIRKLGAEAEIMDMNYDDTVQRVAELAEENGWILVQDTAWKDYEEVPLSIMQGYTTIMSEISEQLGDEAFDQVTHVFLQAGVGSFAGAMAAAIHNLRADDGPKIVIVEPDKADCLYQSVQDASGEPKRVTGALDTMMAGLSCGEPSIQGWDVLKATADAFLSCEDEISAKGMRLLGRPEGSDRTIISGESGAATIGAFHELVTNEGYRDIKESLGLDDRSNVLLISTEGDTDPENYLRVMEGRIH